MPELLSRHFRKRLSLGKYSGWARDLDYDQLEVILWMLGEIYSRRRVTMTTALSAYLDASSQDSERNSINRSAVHFPNGMLHPRQSIASAMLCEFVYGSTRTNLDNATRRMHLYEELIERIEGGEKVDLDLECRRIESYI